MDAVTNLITGRSIRKFKSDMVPKETIEKIIEAGTYAATGMNRQSPVMIAVTNKELRDRLSAEALVLLGPRATNHHGRPVAVGDVDLIYDPQPQTFNL